MRCPAVRCPAVGPDASVSSPQAVAVGTGSRWPGDPDHQNRWRPRWLPGRRRLERRSRRPGRGRRRRRRVGPWEVGGGPGPPGRGAGRGGRPCPLSDQPGQAGRGERPSRAAARWARMQAAARGGSSRRVAGVLGLGARPPGWSSPSLTAGWVASEGPGEVPAGMGARPQRGPSRQRARLARCRQHSDLRRWVVSLPGLEPGTSSLSVVMGRWSTPAHEKWQRGRAPGPSTAPRRGQRRVDRISDLRVCCGRGSFSTQVSRAQRCADQRFPRSRSTVGGEGMRSNNLVWAGAPT